MAPVIMSLSIARPSALVKTRPSMFETMDPRFLSFSISSRTFSTTSVSGAVCLTPILTRPPSGTWPGHLLVQWRGVGDRSCPLSAEWYPLGWNGFLSQRCKAAAVITDKRPEGPFLHRGPAHGLQFHSECVASKLIITSCRYRLDGESAGTRGHPSIRRANKSNRTMFASVQIVKPRAIIPENLSTEHVTHVFNLEKFVRSAGKVRGNVRKSTLTSNPCISIPAPGTRRHNLALQQSRHHRAEIPRVHADRFSAHGDTISPLRIHILFVQNCILHVHVAIKTWKPFFMFPAAVGTIEYDAQGTASLRQVVIPISD